MPTKAIAPVKIERISIKNWTKGVVTALDDGRTPTDGLRASSNVMLSQDGTVRPRPSLVSYGTAFPGTLLGELYEFTKQVSGLTNNNYQLGAFNVAGTVKLYYSKDGGAWTVANGKTYDTTAKLHYCQVDNKVLAMNGVDNLSYLDIPTLAVVPFTAISSPVVASVVATGLAGTTFTYYYRVTANSTFGETAASASNSVAVGTQRDIWLAASQYVTVTWGAVTSAVGYNVYLGTTAGQEVLIASGVNGLSFKDDGTQAFVPNVSQLAPVADTTAGAKVTRAKDINGQIFMTGDADNPHYVRYGGTGDSVLDFSPFNGGGWTELGRGAKDFPLVVESFRDGKGTSQITVLCRSTNGHGKRYLLTPNTTTYGTTVIAYLQTTEDNGQDGTNSPDGVILYNDSLWYPSLDGFKTTGTKPQLQNLLSTDTVSETIQTDVRTLNTSYMDACVGLAYQQRLYWALPVGSTTNNQIWTLDLQRNGAWMKPWGISADWMMLYNDNSGVSHFVIVSGNAMYELTDSQATYDNGVAFPTNLTSGLVKFSEDGMEWAKVIDITFWLLRPQGVINFNISGKTEDSDSLQGVGSNSFVSSSSVAGWGESGWGGSPDAFLPMTPDIFGWSNFSEVPVSFGDARKPVVIEIDEELEWLTYEINTNIGGTFYDLDDVVLQFVKIGVKDIST
jgi:hypothetical protein